MRKIILFIMCVFCTTVFGQDMVRPLYPNTTVSPNHHMTFLGVSMGRSISSFQAVMKQKGLKYIGNDYNIYYFKANVFDQNNLPIEVNLNENKQIFYINSYKEIANKKSAILFFNKVQQSINNSYLNTSKTYRNIIGNNNDTTNYVYWDVFSKEKSAFLGTVILSMSTQHKYNTYYVELSIYDNYNCATEPVRKKYDLSKYISPLNLTGYLDVYPHYSNLTLYTTLGEKEIFSYDSPEDLIILLGDEDYSEMEKQCIIIEYIKEIRDYYVPGNTVLINLPNYKPTITETRWDYDHAKAQYLASHPQKNNGYGIANFFFDSVMGKDLVNFYKSSGQYDYFIDCLKKGSRNGSSSSSSTNWDGLSDSQKAVIHEHDNAR